MAAIDWLSRVESYGLDQPAIVELINRLPTGPIDVRLKEVWTTGGVQGENQFKDVESLKGFLSTESSDSVELRAISVNVLTGKLLQLLGARYDMDYETWTSRLYSSDREYFSSPLHEKGPRFYSHFNLSCVDFYRTTPATPPEFRKSKKINRVTRIITFLKGGQEGPIIHTNHQKQRRMYIIRRVSGHLRYEGKLWTFLYFCDPFESYERSAYVRDIPGAAMCPLDMWLQEAFSSQSSVEHMGKITQDGFGLTVKILRDIKSSWKLFLAEMGIFLEDLAENFTDQEVMSAASQLYREFLPSLDNFQRDLFYHRRYVSNLINRRSSEDRYIIPSAFIEDLEREENALAVLDDRLKTIRERFTNVMEMVLNLTNIELIKLQRRDAETAFQQGESIKRLTVVNMFYLPPSFIAGVYGMNTTSTQGTSLWSFALVAFIFTAISLLVINQESKLEYIKKFNVLGFVWKLWKAKRPA